MGCVYTGGIHSKGMGPLLHDPAAWTWLTGPGVGTHSSGGPRDFFNLEPKVVDGVDGNRG